MSAEYIIERSNSWVRIPWREIIQYRDLLFLLVRRDFVSRYKQTILGPLWFVLQPVLTTVVFTVIFDKVAKISTDQLPPVLFYMCGLLAWGYFAQCIGGTSSTFTSNAALFGKVYFPRLIIPLSVVISNLMSFLIQLVVFMGFWIWFKLFTGAGATFHCTPLMLALPFILLLTASAGLGVGLWMSALSAKYRDFSHLTGFLTQIWMFATPVVYPLSQVPQKWQYFYTLNPMAVVVESYRHAFLGAGTVSVTFLFVSVAVTSLFLFTGLVVFSRSERNFIDTV